jgi:hypothetical protein
MPPSHSFPPLGRWRGTSPSQAANCRPEREYAGSPNLAAAPRWLYEAVYCARGQAENLVNGVARHGQPLLKRTLARGRVLEFFAICRAA